MQLVARRFGYVLWLMASFVITQVQAAPLLDPEPVAVPPGLVEQSVVKAIRLGSVKRGWIVSKEGPGWVEAGLDKRGHVVKVTIKYDAQVVTIGYLSSENMEYREWKDQRHIHRKYNQWVRNLALDIGAQLVQLSVASQ